MNNRDLIYRQNRQILWPLIEQAGFTDLENFSHSSDIPIWQISRLLYGLLPKINLDIFLKLSEFLKLPVHQLLILFYPQDKISTVLLEELKSFNNLDELRLKTQELETTLLKERESHSLDTLRLEQQLELENSHLQLEENQKQEALINSEHLQQELEVLTERFRLMEENFAADKEKITSQYYQQLAQEKESLKQDYEQLQIQHQQEKDRLKQEFQDATLQTLESLLIQLPTVTAAIQQTPEFPSVKLLPLFRPIPQLLKDWQIEAIGSVGAEVAYNPQDHQLLEGEAEIGDRVRVHYIGYKQNDRLLYRAKVSQVF